MYSLQKNKTEFNLAAVVNWMRIHDISRIETQYMGQDGIGNVDKIFFDQPFDRLNCNAELDEEHEGPDDYIVSRWTDYRACIDVNMGQDAEARLHDKMALVKAVVSYMVDDYTKLSGCDRWTICSEGQLVIQSDGKLILTHKDQDNPNPTGHHYAANESLLIVPHVKPAGIRIR